MVNVQSENPLPRRVIVLGSTGSIGRQALNVIASHPDQFTVVGLAAGGSRAADLAAQRAAFPDALIASATPGVPEARFTGPQAAAELVRAIPADVVLNGITGSIGLAPTLAALETGTLLALANKESLVAGGQLVLSKAAPGQIIPVDSEHSALAQCLRAGQRQEVDRLVLTASGGPFRGRCRAELHDITVDQALAHPTWQMGPVVTINSATLANKGLEIIEAHLLFGLPYERIDVVVHPQSVIHSMVTFTDGATIAQASPPSMELPIALALAWPYRLDQVIQPCDFSTQAQWAFEPVDEETFNMLTLARQAGQAGGLLPCVYNAANEIAVQAFRDKALSFLGIASTVQAVLADADSFADDPRDADDVAACETWARQRARAVVGAA